MYKIYGYWSAPERAEEVDAFEDEYVNVHVPIAAKVPGLRRLITTRSDCAHGGGAAHHYRVAELVFDSREAMEAGLASPEYQAVGSHGAGLVEKYGVTITADEGEEISTSTVDG
jgi:uncharacterized protein (TIGR02118 family)